MEIVEKRTDVGSGLITCPFCLRSVFGKQKAICLHTLFFIQNLQTKYLRNDFEWEIEDSFVFDSEYQIEAYVKNTNIPESVCFKTLNNGDVCYIGFSKQIEPILQKFIRQ